MAGRKIARALLWCFLCLSVLVVPGCTGPPAPPLEELEAFRMDTYFRLAVSGLTGAQKEAVLREVTELDRLLDRFSPDSDISRINAGAGQPVPVGDRTLDLLAQALDLAAETGGAFDPTVGPLADLWQIGPAGAAGEEESWRPPDPAEVARVLPLVDYRKLQLDPDRKVAQLVQPGMGLDVGGIAKGYAVDRVAALLKGWGIENALIDFGGDYYVLGKHPEGRPWKLGIRHPRDPSQVMAVLAVQDCAVTTSGDYQRYRLYQGQRFSHLLDPFTGYPARELTSVTVLAPSGVVADALATAVFVLGPEKGLALVEEWPGVEAVLVDRKLEIQVSSGMKDYISFPE